MILFLLFSWDLRIPRFCDLQNGIFGNVIRPLRLIGLKIYSANNGATTMKGFWMIAVGSVLGMLVTGVGSFESSKEDHARELLLIQTLASAHLESNGIKPS